MKIISELLILIIVIITVGDATSKRSEHPQQSVVTVENIPPKSHNYQQPRRPIKKLMIQKKELVIPVTHDLFKDAPNGEIK